MPTEVPPTGKIAIIGIGCRMPPNAGSLQAFWKFLLKGGNALRPIKKDRWDVRQFFDEDPARPGKSYAPKAASLDADIRQFDPLAFGISPREAAILDPQQRLILEVAWEAFEDAGLPLERMSGSSTGVFIGGFCLDHLIHQSQPSNRYLINAHSPGGVMMTVLSNRISHVFNLRGPSLTIDTACSSSLVALHYACQSLRNGEAGMALAGGVNVMGRPEFPIIMSKGHFLSHHGECHAFDETAAGYARGEGAGVLVLKRYEDAVAAGDTIHAVISGSGVNQDGHTDGISLPNSEAQERLVRQVYAQAGVPCGDVDYVEAHGTGTQAGDSAELGALNRNFAQGRTTKLLVGSVKTNIGHLEAAAGVAGIIKAIGVLKFRQVPKNLHFVHPNPKIPFADYELEVAKETRTLPGPDEKPTLYVGINSFGYGGTNAHILMESAPAAVPAPAPARDEAPRLVPFSAHSDKALRDLSGKFAFLLGGGQIPSLGDLAYTTAFRRSHLPQRMVAMAGSLEELREQLIAASTGQPHEGVVTSGKGGDTDSPLAFVYTGMGPQWWGMGQELVKKEKIVSETFDEIDAIFQPLAGWSLKEAMLADEASSRMERTELAQPANFAIQLALTRLWASYGIHPDAVVGHSVGEVTAAHVAGVYTLEEAIQVSYHRSRLQQTMAGRGSMLAVGLNEEEALALIADLPGVSVAAVNSFSAVTLSGDSDQLKQLAADLEQRGIFQKFLRVEVAYHSPQMDPLRDEIFSALAALSPQPARIPLYSTAYGRIVPSADWTAAYWWQNVRQAVHFAPAIQAMFEDGFSRFLEIGPHPVLGNSIKECAAHLERKVTCFVSLRRKEPESARLLLTLAELYCAGYDPDWSALAPREGRFISSPQYSWQREQYWVESERSRMERLGLPGPVYLSRTVLGPKPCWEVEVNRNYFPFLFDHGVQDQTVFPGMGYIEAALSLNQLLHDGAAVILENVSFERVLIVDYSKLQYLLTEHDQEAGRFIISSRVEGEEHSVQRHCRGRLLPQAEPRPGRIDLAAYRADCPEPVTVEAFHDRLHRRELHYGPTFTAPVTDVHVGPDCFLVRIDADITTDENHLLYPPIFDAALRGVLYCASGERLFVPFSFEQFHFYSRPADTECYACGRLISQNDSLIVADVWLTDASGQIHAHARRLSLQAIDMATTAAPENPFYQWEWKPAPIETQTDLTGVLILADSASEALAHEFARSVPGSQVVATEGDGIDPSALVQTLSAGKLPHLVSFWGAGVSEGAESAARLNEKVISLIQAAAEVYPDEVDITLVTTGAKSVSGEPLTNLPAASLSAVGLVGQNEFNAVTCRSVDFSPGAFSAADLISEISGRTRGDIAYRDGVRYESALLPFVGEESARLVSVPLDTPVELQWSTNGRLESLGFAQVERHEPAAGEIELRIHTVALNYKDVLKVEGHIHPIVLEQTFWGTDLGMECTGVVERVGPGSRFAPGDKVVTILPRGFRSYATLPETFVEKIPGNLGMEAAAIPVVYLTAYRGLVEIARLQPGERVLIHNATGGLGLAAINIAQGIGAEIFATAGSPAKRQYLADLGVQHVFSSRDVDFATRILEMTDHKGVDVVIGAQTGQTQHASLSLLRTNGRYIEVGKKDIAEDNGLPMRAFNRNILFASVDIDRLAYECPEIMQVTMRRVLAHFASGEFVQKELRTYPAAQIKEAFFEMARSRHLGKILIDFSTGEVEVPERSGRLIKPDGAYIVTGGTSGFGLATATWLAAHGAGRVILVSRSGKTAPGIGDALRALEAKGVKAEAMSVDVTDPQAVRDLVAHAQQAPYTLRGVFHGAMVLDDAMMKDLTGERFRRVFHPKVAGALNFAAALRGRNDFDFLVFYSSISAVVGNRGQTNYVAANALLDGLAHSLRAQGFPALSINWGALAETGVVARDERLGTILATAGITGLNNQQAFTAMEKSLGLRTPQMAVFLVEWKKWHEAHPHLANDPRFRELRIRSQDEGGNDVSSQIRKALADSSKEQRLRALEDHLQDVLAATLKMSKDTVSVNRKINEMGVDSLMVLELSLGIKERIGVGFSAMEFLKGPTLQQLATMAEGRLWGN